MISLDRIPNFGTTVSLDGQVYELVGTEHYTRKDGGLTTLLVWETACPDCGDPFRCRSTLKNSGLVRRCVGCAKVGKPVKGKRGRKVMVEVAHA